MQKYNRRMVFLLVLVAVVLIVYAGRLINLQLVEGETYLNMSVKKSLRTVSIPAPRGEIYDRNGVPLVVNNMGYSVKLDKAYLPTEERGDILLTVLDVLEENGFVYEDSLPIGESPYSFDIVGEEDEEGKKKFARLLKTYSFPETVTAQEVMDRLIKDFNLADYTPAQQRRLAGLLYDAQLQGFSYTVQFTLASGVDIKTVTMIKERSNMLPGVVVEVEPIRTFVAGGFASHILGQVGSIYKEEKEKYLEEGYLLSDKVGKAGVEKSMEQYLRGTAGERAIERNITTGEVNSTITTQPVSGNNIYLTIDINLQRTLEYSLANTIASIAAKGTPGKRDGADANAGAAVLIDVNTGEVLASATYPTYDSSDYQSNYTALASDEGKPLVNRAIAGLYPPGSTFKIATALAALQSGVVGTDTVIVDKGIYDYYAPDYTPHCWVYDDYGRTHGRVNLSEAIRVSCNYYFYEVGRLMGIDQLDAVCRLLGLGEKTGINLPGEASGTLAGPDYAESVNQPWYAGDTLSAAIGQSYNQFTPLQLANYIATVVNGGTRYQTQIVDKIMTYHSEKLVEEIGPNVVEQIDIRGDFYQAIMQGMRSVTEDGTASSIFRDYDIAVGGKTGTAQVQPGTTANGIFVAFAPYDDPQIAIAIVIEHGAHGNSAAPVAKEMFDAYFKGIYYNESGEKVIPESQQPVTEPTEATTAPTSQSTQSPSEQPTAQAPTEAPTAPAVQSTDPTQGTSEATVQSSG